MEAQRSEAGEGCLCLWVCLLGKDSLLLLPRELPQEGKATKIFLSSSKITNQFLIRQRVQQTTTVVRQVGPGLAFFQHVNNQLRRDYILIVDKSGSMAGGNWREAEKAVSALAPNITNCDPDGITLYFFSSKG